MSDYILETKNINKIFGAISALKDFSMQIPRRSIYGIIGPNGAGKSTLFNIISGFIPPDSGEVLFNNCNMLGLSAYRIARLGLGRTFQSLKIIKNISVLDNVLLSFKKQIGENIFFLFFKSSAFIKQDKYLLLKAKGLLDFFGLIEKCDELAENLSFGQQKLLALCCCVANDAELLLLDEPIAGISQQLSENILNIIRKLADNGKTILIVEQSVEAIFKICDQIIFMDSGIKVAQGTAEEMINNPKITNFYLE